MLGADGYGSLAALLNLTVILFVPGAALQVAAAREGTLGHLGRGGELAGTLRRWTRHILILLAVVAVGAALVREPLAAVLNVEQEWAAAAVPVTGVMWLLAVPAARPPAGRPRLQGGRAERRARGAGPARCLGSPSSASAPASRAPTSARSPRSRSPPRCVGYVLSRRLGAPTPGARQHPLRAVARDAALPIAVLTIVAALQNVDVIMAKHVLSDSVAGVYAATTVAAKAVVWIAVGLGFWVLPEATAPSRRGRRPARRARPRAGRHRRHLRVRADRLRHRAGAAAADRVRRRVRDRRDRAAGARRRLRAARRRLHRRAVPARPAPPLVRRRARAGRAHRADPAGERRRPRELRLRGPARAGARRLRRARPRRPPPAPRWWRAPHDDRRPRPARRACGVARRVLAAVQSLGPVRDQKAGLAAVTAKDSRARRPRLPAARRRRRAHALDRAGAQPRPARRVHAKRPPARAPPPPLRRARASPRTTRRGCCSPRPRARSTPRTARAGRGAGAARSARRFRPTS